ncbi:MULTISPECIES: DsrE family protein [Marinobacter]|uniref:tRNA 2-thiouridine synthesizing protein C n=1 Tax=Marinobacter segnicrescens TaxID=430453 RepID=A0A1I0D312_9GAMM|nr:MULTISPECIES: DsrE family protein [Marinobacter]UZD67564.1 DsrE family protein [Marinobacter sp. AN1]SET26307.1 tRNA 2-thiouridine synthesizing protein C [Marinobacter segnicrescens]
MSDATTKTLLIVIDSPPYGDWRGREALDMAFSLAAFDQPVALLFRGEGVNWLRPGQDGASINQKTVSRNLGAARMFGVSELFADTASLARFGVERPQPEVEPVVADAAFYTRFQEVIQP